MALTIPADSPETHRPRAKLNEEETTRARKIGRFGAAALALAGWVIPAIVTSPMASASASSPMASASPAPSGLNGGQCMAVGSELVSPDRAYTLVMQSDGNLADYAGWGFSVGQRWLGFSSNTNSGAHACMQNDGNFVVYSAANKPLWWSGTNGSGSDEHLVMQNDGNLVIYNNAYTRAIWSTGYSTQTWCYHVFGYSVANFYWYPLFSKIAGETDLDAYVCSDAQSHSWFQNMDGTGMESTGPHCWVDPYPEIGRDWATGSCAAWIDGDGGVTFGMAAAAQAANPSTWWALQYAVWTTYFHIQPGGGGHRLWYSAQQKDRDFGITEVLGS